jgi:pimeloyl-ACP methyl ester carboxylesterase
VARLASITGRYLYLDVLDVEYRVYYEESGDGIPLVLQHTAGTDGRQWRHLLEDPEITANFRLIAPDLPYHAKSLPPTSVRWWETEYKLTRKFFLAFILKLSEALGLERPVFMGCSMGGHLATDLAIDYPGQFRAVIGLEAGMETESTASAKLLEWYFHPRINNDFKSALMYTFTAPTSPESLRRETAFLYSQGAPVVSKGDLHYYGLEHDIKETAKTIDTTKCMLYILGGSYDWSGTPEVCRALHNEVKGSYYQEMEGLGHFPMSENPELFKKYLTPVLADIIRREPRAS